MNPDEAALIDKVLVPLWLSLKVAGAASIAAIIAGVSMAYLISRHRFPGREWLDAVLTLPLVLPPTIIGYYLLVVIGRNGWLGSWLFKNFGTSLIFSWKGAVIAAALVSVPLIFKSARAAFEEVDGNIEDAARTLGLNELEVFIRVSLPLAWRGILAGSVLAFARAMGEFGATLMVAGNLPGKTQTLSLAVYDAVQAGNDRLASVLVVITSLTCIAVLLFSGRLVKSSNRRELAR